MDPARRPGPVLAVLAVLTALAPLSVDVYTPSLPRIGADLGGAPWVIQSSITACLAGIGIGQLAFGPLSDRIGRRPVILVGVAGWTLASVASAFVPSALTLVAIRGVAGLFGSAGIVAARSVVRDVSEDRAVMGGRVAVLATVSAGAPVVAPVLGAAVAALWGWRADFLTLAGVGALVIVGVLVLVPETRTADAVDGPRAVSSGSLVGAVRESLGAAFRSRELRGVAAMLAAQSFGFYAYVATASYVVERELGYGRDVFTLVFATNAAAMVGANLLFRRLARRNHPGTLAGAGLVVSLLAGGALAAIAVSRGPDPLLWAASALFAAGVGLVLPGSHTWGQLTDAPSGSASALTGSAQFLGGVLGSPVTGLLGATALSLGFVLVASSAVALGVHRRVRRASR
ncbi:MFS transporter [Curtobacterium pusillum]|uniref:MFS transporter n=1 Tax=Curtobacterium pusillum TaxID=69373 RepID=A0ABX2MB42_9MICO|nr:MFS transporter [Curtobacterium pusillum]NUU15257.1 MFS transporter [Curtobacterium pusillum]